MYLQIFFFLRFVFLILILIAINVDDDGALCYKRMLHRIEGPIMEDLYNPNNQKVVLLSCASVAFHSSNFNKTSQSSVSSLFFFHHMMINIIALLFFIL